jgi:polyisoprenoid-binding protein YceI
MAPRDKDLRGPKFLDVENYPTVTFVSTRIEPSTAGWKLHGDLTIKDVTRSVTLDMEPAESRSNDRLVFTATTELTRSDWDGSWKVPLGRTGLVVSKTWQLDIEAHVLPA